MDYRTLGRSGCAVSNLALGTMTFGVETAEPGAHEQLDVFLEAGGTLVDTADVYGGGESERIIGRWLADRPADLTDRVVLATKGRFPTADDPNGAGLSARHLTRALDASLARLGVDRVDLYQAHAYDPVDAAGGDAADDGRLRPRRQGGVLGAVELHRLAADQAGAAGPGDGSAGAGDPAAAVQPGGTRDRVGDRAGRARRRDGAAAVEPARRRLPVREVHPRAAARRRHPARRRPGPGHGGLGAARHRADLGGDRRGAADRRGPRRRRWPRSRWPGSPTGPG